MARRLLAFALAFVVMGVPLGGDVCEAVCADHAAHGIGSPMPASHHHHPESQVAHHHDCEVPPAPGTQRALTPLRHRCGHLDAVVTPSRELTRRQIVQAVMMMARITPLTVHASPTSETENRHGPPTPTRSASHLRI
jgi:hypothetical protein